MFSKRSLSIVAAFTLCAGALRASAGGTGAEVYPDESGIPDSIEYRDRMIARHSPSNEEVEATESANPDSVGYGDRMIVSNEPISSAAWLALEFGNPDFR